LVFFIILRCGACAMGELLLYPPRNLPSNFAMRGGARRKP
jgi:hypothetical protein